MPDCSGEPVVTTSCAFYFAHETAGAARIQHSLRPPFVLGEQFLYHSGASRGENAEVCLASLRGAKATKQSSFLVCALIMDCFAGARDDGAN
jgi:hypothetical protein